MTFPICSITAISARIPGAVMPSSFVTKISGFLLISQGLKYRENSQNCYKNKQFYKLVITLAPLTKLWPPTVCQVARFFLKFISKRLMNAILQFMKRNYKILLVVVALAVAMWGFMPKEKSDPGKDRLLLELLAFVIDRGHYEPADIDDEFSKGVYKDYVTALDPSKRFFLQSDIDEFAKYETQLDDQ